MGNTPSSYQPVDSASLSDTEMGQTSQQRVTRNKARQLQQQQQQQQQLSSTATGNGKNKENLGIATRLTSEQTQSVSDLIMDPHDCLFVHDEDDPSMTHAYTVWTTLLIVYTYTWLFTTLCVGDPVVSLFATGPNSFTVLILMTVAAGVILCALMCAGKNVKLGGAALVLLALFAITYTGVLCWIASEFTAWIVTQVYLMFMLFAVFVLASTALKTWNMTAIMGAILVFILTFLIILSFTLAPLGISRLSIFIAVVAMLAMGGYTVWDSWKLQKARTLYLAFRKAQNMPKETLMERLADAFATALRIYICIPAWIIYVYQACAMCCCPAQAMSEDSGGYAGDFAEEEKLQEAKEKADEKATLAQEHAAPVTPAR